MENKELLKAFLTAKKELQKIEFVKDKVAHNYKYLDLATILIHLEPILTNNDLILTFNIEGERKFYGELIHVESGQCKRFDYGNMPVSEVERNAQGNIKAGKDSPQLWGSALTYARRYMILNIFNIIGDEDTDGVPKNEGYHSSNNYSKSQTSYTSPTKTEPKKYPKIEKEQVTITSTSISKKDYKSKEGVVKAIVNIKTGEGEEEALFVNAFNKNNAPKTDSQLIAGGISQLIQTKQNRIFNFSKEIIQYLNLGKEQKDYFMSKKGNNEIVFEDSFAGVPF